MLNKMEIYSLSTYCKHFSEFKKKSDEEKAYTSFLIKTKELKFPPTFEGHRGLNDTIECLHLHYFTL